MIGKLTFEDWCELNEDEINIELAENGADREMDFDSEREFDLRYEKYLEVPFGIDRVVDKINEVYDYAQKELEIIPYWITYRIEYDELITSKQDEMAIEGLQASGMSRSNALVNIPLSFDKIRELIKQFGFEQIKEVLINFKTLSENKIFI